MKFVTAECLQAMDRAAIAAGTPGIVLMNRAGRGIAEHLLEFDPRGVLFVAGRGNNGGDAFTAARYLQRLGIPCQVWVAGTEADLSPDAAHHFRMMKNEVPHLFMPEESDWRLDRVFLPLADVVVDALLGTGTNGAPQGEVAAAVRMIHDIGHHMHVVSIDVPTGLDPDSGKVHNPCVRADLTLTLALPKLGFLEAEARARAGSIECVDIGLPMVEGYPSMTATRFVGPPPRIRRPRDVHKGTYGRLLCIGGASGYTGAIAMAARGALRSGVGTVTVLTALSQAPVVAAAAPEAMVVGTPETTSGSIAHVPFFREQPVDPKRFDAVLMGPGMTTHNDTLELVRRVLRELPEGIPVVLDADAINVYARRANWIGKTNTQVVMTPHPGELAGLLVTDAATVQADRIGKANEVARETKATVVLKGEGTVIASHEHPAALNLNGGPGMATGGTGDILAGYLAGRLAQGDSPQTASATAVYRHGRAGDLAAWKHGESAMQATDLLEYL